MDISEITPDVLIGTTPWQADFERLQQMGVRLVINMRWWGGHQPRAMNPPIEYLRLRTFDNPLIPIPTSALVRGATAARRAIRDGGKVYAHCSRGRHRSVAMAAAILIAQGYDPERAMALIKEKRQEADPGAIHIRPRIIEFAEIWKQMQTAAE